MELLYDDGVGSENTQYNGNIAAITWQNALDGKERSYGFDFFYAIFFGDMIKAFKAEFPKLSIQVRVLVNSSNPSFSFVLNTFHCVQECGYFREVHSNTECRKDTSGHDGLGNFASVFASWWVRGYGNLNFIKVENTLYFFEIR